MRLYGLIEKIGIDQSLQHPLLDHEVNTFRNNLRKNRFNLRLFLRQEQYYSPEAKDHIYVNGPMMVRVPLEAQVTQMGRRYWYENTKDSQDLSETPEEFELLFKWVADPERPPAPPSLELVEDDPFIKRIVAALPPGKAVAVVTDDLRLCREIAAETQVWVCRVPVKWYYMSLYFGEGDEPWLRKLSEAYPLYEWQTIEDSGSIKSYEEVGFRDGSPLQWPMVRPFSLTSVSWKSGRRVRSGASKVPYEEDFAWEPQRFPDGFLYTKSNLLQRRKHPYKRGFA
jgi:hypothetical protein